MHEQLGAGAQRRVGDRVEVADDHVRLEPDLEQCVGSPVDGDEHRLEVADVRPHDAEIPLVAGAADDDDRVTVAEPRLERRELDPLGEQPAFVPQVAQRVVGKCLERVRDTALLLGEGGASVVLVELDADGETASVAPDAAAAHADRLPVAHLVEELRAGHVDRLTPARTSSSGPGFGKRPEVDARR